MTQNAITFDENGFEPRPDHKGIKLWYTPDGDGFGLVYYDIAPDINADLNKVDEVRAFYRQATRNVGLGIIEIDVMPVDGCLAVRTIFKAAQQPSGRTYIGALTFPFRDFSYVLKVQCAEAGPTGARDAVLMMVLMEEGKVSSRTVGNVMADWLDDPYDPNEKGEMTRNKSERPEYDSQFPMHPLSRARRVLDHLQRTATVDSSIKSSAPFGR